MAGIPRLFFVLGVLQPLEVGQALYPKGSTFLIEISKATNFD
jgi:hypothetical protein